MKRVPTVYNTLFLCAALLFVPQFASAQQSGVTAQAATDTVPDMANNGAGQVTLQKSPNVFDESQYKSLVFTSWERSAITDARLSKGDQRAVAEWELEEALNRTEEVKEPPRPEERELILGGILFHDREDWTIWLNKKRVTPEALPEEVYDLNVYENYIEMKWYDEYTNRIFPLRMRAHQRFNLDTRIFLPG